MERNKKILLFVFISAIVLLRIGIGIFVPEPADLVRWVSIENAEQQAREQDKPILYDFTAEWCLPCKKMDRELYANKERAEKINFYFIPVRVTDRQREDGRNSPVVEHLQKRYGVTGFPTLVVVYVTSTKDPVILQGYGGKDVTMEALERAYRASKLTARLASIDLRFD